MPTFTGIEVTTTADVDFEIFCAGCGAGICSNGDTRKSRSRQMPQVTIEPCEKCLAAARSEGEDKARAELESRIADLEAELDETKTLMWPNSISVEVSRSSSVWIGAI